MELANPIMTVTGRSVKCYVIAPLPTFWIIKGRFYGRRIDSLPPWYIAKALEWKGLRPCLRAALLAVSGFRALAGDQQEGR